MAHSVMQYDPGHFPSLFQWAGVLLGMMLGVFAYREKWFVFRIISWAG